MIYETGRFMVCVDCLQWLANADASGLDYYYSASESEQRLEEIKTGEKRLTQMYGDIVIGDTEGDDEFSRSACDCCGSGLGGTRHEIVTLAPAIGRESRDPFDRHPPVIYADDRFIISARVSEPTRRALGLSYTTDGYGNKIPTRYRVRCADNRERRVYCRIYSNIGSLYIMYKGQALIIDVGAEHMLEQARDDQSKGER